MLRYVCDTGDVSVPKVNEITIEKTLAKLNTLAELHDYLESWLTMETEIKEMLPEGSAIVFEVEDRVAQVLRSSVTVRHCYCGSFPLQRNIATSFAMRKHMSSCKIC